MLNEQSSNLADSEVTSKLLPVVHDRPLIEIECQNNQKMIDTWMIIIGGLANYRLFRAGHPHSI